MNLPILPKHPMQQPFNFLTILWHFLYIPRTIRVQHHLLAAAVFCLEDALIHSFGCQLLAIDLHELLHKHATPLAYLHAVLRYALPTFFQRSRFLVVGGRIHRLYLLVGVLVQNEAFPGQFLRRLRNLRLIVLPQIP